MSTVPGCVCGSREARGSGREGPGSYKSVTGRAATCRALSELRTENALQRMGSIISTVCRRIDAKAVCLAGRYYSTE